MYTNSHESEYDRSICFLCKNLSESVDNLGLQALFGKFGTVMSCKVATFEDGKSKGHGFVQFDSEDSANSATENLNGSLVHDKHMYFSTSLHVKS